MIERTIIFPDKFVERLDKSVLSNCNSFLPTWAIKQHHIDLMALNSFFRLLRLQCKEMKEGFVESKQFQLGEFGFPLPRMSNFRIFTRHLNAVLGTRF